jgi:hypothetical protein
MIKNLTFTRPGIGDVIVLLLCILLIPASVIAMKQNPASVTAVQILSPGKETQILPLHPDRILEVKGRLGISVIEILDGTARFISSPCTGQHCVLSGWHRHSGDGMACLPNRVAITLVAKQDDFDGMNF